VIAAIETDAVIFGSRGASAASISASRAARCWRMTTAMRQLSEAKSVTSHSIVAEKPALLAANESVPVFSRPG
jgi:hypothetical protein